MKENFDNCLKMLLKHEGGYVNHPRDPGGETNLGVTRATYEQWVGRQVMDGEMKTLTVDDVAPIYKQNYWDKLRADELPSGVDWAVFDWGVNSGTGRSAKALQRIVGATPDGAIGPRTIASVKEMEPEKIVREMHRVRQAFYEGLKTFDAFGKGWTRRNSETLEQALHLLAQND
jgi:lysozyme family protein